MAGASSRCDQGSWTMQKPNACKSPEAPLCARISHLPKSPSLRYTNHLRFNVPSTSPQPERTARCTGEKGTIAAPYPDKGVKFATQFVTYCNDTKLASNQFQQYMGGNRFLTAIITSVQTGRLRGIASPSGTPRGPSGLKLRN
jgi:hypothetical protein